VKHGGCFKHGGQKFHKGDADQSGLARTALVLGNCGSSRARAGRGGLKARRGSRVGGGPTTAVVEDLDRQGRKRGGAEPTGIDRRGDRQAIPRSPTAIPLTRPIDPQSSAKEDRARRAVSSTADGKRLVASMGTSEVSYDNLAARQRARRRAFRSGPAASACPSVNGRIFCWRQRAGTGVTSIERWTISQSKFGRRP